MNTSVTGIDVSWQEFQRERSRRAARQASGREGNSIIGSSLAAHAEEDGGHRLSEAEEGGGSGNADGEEDEEDEEEDVTVRVGSGLTVDVAWLLYELHWTAFDATQRSSDEPGERAFVCRTKTLSSGVVHQVTPLLRS